MAHVSSALQLVEKPRFLASGALYIFKHDSALGNAPSHELFDRIQVKKKDPGSPARAFSDYEIAIDEEAMPEGVTLVRK